jgi:CheY-like chemotaxis protein
VGKGTGLGLSMVHGLALQSGGTLVLESRPGVGTTANIWLPALVDGTAVAAEPVPAEAADAIWRGPPLTILAVDDDELVLLNTADMLSEHGHRVLSARSAGDALVMLGQMNVDLVITDHAMPQMTGVQLAERLRQSHPGLPVILVSGYAELPPEAAVDLPRLAKPFSQQALLEIIARTAASRD